MAININTEQVVTRTRTSKFERVHLDESAPWEWDQFARAWAVFESGTAKLLQVWKESDPSPVFERMGGQQVGDAYLLFEDFEGRHHPHGRKVFVGFAKYDDDKRPYEFVVFERAALEVDDSGNVTAWGPSKRNPSTANMVKRYGESLPTQFHYLAELLSGKRFAIITGAATPDLERAFYDAFEARAMRRGGMTPDAIRAYFTARDAQEEDEEEAPAEEAPVQEATPVVVVEPRTYTWIPQSYGPTRSSATRWAAALAGCQTQSYEDVIAEYEAYDAKLREEEALWDELDDDQCDSFCNCPRCTEKHLLELQAQIEESAAR